MAEFLYVCQFSNGHIKVGRSIDPMARIAQHADRVACMGVDLSDHFAVMCTGRSAERETWLIARCAERASARFKSEWFDGLGYPEICAFARQAAIEELPEGPGDMPSKDDRLRLAAKLKVSPGVLLQALNGERPCSPITAVRYEQESGGELTRKRLRPADWHLIWPELIDIPRSP